MNGLGVLFGNVLAVTVRVLTVVAIFGLGVFAGCLWMSAHRGHP